MNRSASVAIAIRCSRPMEEELPQFPAERRPARVGTSRNRDLLSREPVDEQAALGRFPGAVETIERKEYRFRHFLRQ